MKRIVVPVGRYVARQARVAGTDTHEVQRGAQSIEISLFALFSWLGAHEPLQPGGSLISGFVPLRNALAHRLRTLSPSSCRIANMIAILIGIDALQRHELLVEVKLTPKEIRRFAERYRLVPLLPVLSLDEVTTDTRGYVHRLSAPLHGLSPTMMGLWRWSPVTPNLWEACRATASMADSGEVGDAPIEPGVVAAEALMSLHSLLMTEMIAVNEGIGGSPDPVSCPVTPVASSKARPADAVGVLGEMSDRIAWDGKRAFDAALSAAGWRKQEDLSYVAGGGHVRIEARRTRVGAIRPRSHDPDQVLALSVLLDVDLDCANLLSEPDAFAHAARQLADLLGPPSAKGAHAAADPYSPGASWGSPFLRWRGQENSLELLAGPHGPELWLLPTDEVEGWPVAASSGRWSPSDIGGFLVVDDADPRNWADPRMVLPGTMGEESWSLFSSALSQFFARLPAELEALRMRLFVTLQTADGSGGILIAAGPESIILGLRCGPGEATERILDEVGRWIPTGDVCPPGWETVPNGRLHRYKSDIAPSGDEGADLAEMLVRTVQLLGVADPQAFGTVDFLTEPAAPDRTIVLMGLRMHDWWSVTEDDEIDGADSL